MKTHALALCLPMLAAAAVPASEIALPRMDREAPRAPTPVDPSTLLRTGGPGTVVGPVSVNLADIPTGDPERIPGVLRGHAQGDPGSGIVRDQITGDVSDESFIGPSGPADITAGADAAMGFSPGDILRNFQAQGASGWIPPDPVLAVGYRHILEALNSGFTIFTKDGGLERSYTDLETFFDPIIDILPAWSANGFVFDPRVIFVPEYGKFVIFALAADDINQDSYAFIAVSQTLDPLGGWWQYYFSDPHHPANWIDYSGLSADTWGLYFTGQEFPWAGGFFSSIIYSIQPAIFSGGGVNSWIFWDLRWPTGGNPLAFEIQPVVPHTIAGGQETFFVTTFPSSGNQACRWVMTGDRGNSPSMAACAAIPVQAYADPGVAPQPAPAADDIEMFYAGVQNANYAQRKVYFALNDDGATNTGFYVSKVDVDTLVEDRNITYYFASDHYYYPNLSLYGSNTFNPLIGVAMSWSSDTQNPSGALKLYENFTVDSSGEFWNTSGGAGTYNVYYQGRNRWGDYMGAAKDWYCNTMWAVTEYTSATNQWTTRITGMAGDTPLTGICNLIFDDGFTRGSTANWSSSVP